MPPLSPSSSLTSDLSSWSESNSFSDRPSRNTSPGSTYDEGSGSSNSLNSSDLFSFPSVKRSVTFGLSAAPKLEAVHHLSGWKIKALINTYSSIMSTTGLLRRGEFRVSCGWCYLMLLDILLRFLAQIRCAPSPNVHLLPRRWVWSGRRECFAKSLASLRTSLLSCRIHVAQEALFVLRTTY